MKKCVIPSVDPFPEASIQLGCACARMSWTICVIIGLGRTMPFCSTYATHDGGFSFPAVYCRMGRDATCMQKRLDSRAEMREDLPPLHAEKRFGKRAVTGMGACMSGMWWDVVIMTFLPSGGGDFEEVGGGDTAPSSQQTPTLFARWLQPGPCEVVAWRGTSRRFQRSAASRDLMTSNPRPISCVIQRSRLRQGDVFQEFLVRQVSTVEH
ncbi:hypothetical protein J3F84DRAFT_354661 [Trichoderma pleuroticola]